MSRPFCSDNVIDEKVSESTLKGYHIGFEQNKFRLLPLVDVIRNVIPEFALGYHEKPIPLPSILEKMKEAADIVYSTDKYENRGEFGELILHLLLRDFHNTIPLVSKIYFKDNPNIPAHGFDGVQISISGDVKKLWLGESKIYTSGKEAVKALARDLENHLNADYLHSEFNLIARRLPENTPEIEYWRNLLDKHQSLDKIFNSIIIPILCTYNSDLFSKYNDNTPDYFTDFIKECNDLYTTFLANKPDIKTEIILMLMPIQSKDDLISELHKRLRAMQNI